MSTHSLSSEASEASEASTSYYSCREGDTSASASEADVASFKSFSSRSISTLNSYQSALSYLSSGTGYMSALDVEEDAQTLQGDEFGPDFQHDDGTRGSSEGSTPTPVPDGHSGRRLSASSHSSTDTLENDKTPIGSTSNLITADILLEDERVVNSEERISFPSPANCLEKSVISTVTQIEMPVASAAIAIVEPVSRSVSSSPVGDIPDVQKERLPPSLPDMKIQVPEPRHIFPVLPSDRGDSHVLDHERMAVFHPSSEDLQGQSETVQRCWSNSRGSFVLSVVIGLSITMQVLLRSGMDEDFSWWKLVIIRAIIQCVLSGCFIVAKRILAANTDVRIGWTWTFDSYRWIYFSQTILTLVFVASVVEAVQRIPSSTLATVFHLLPVVIIAVDVARIKKTPNFMCYISTALLIACSFILTWPPSCAVGDDSEVCHPPPENINGSSIAWTPPMFNADLIFGWPIDPRNQDNSTLNENGENSGSVLVTQIVLIILALICPSTSLIIISNKDKLDPIKVLFFQGLGALIFCLVDTHAWTYLWYSQGTSLLVYNIIIAMLGIAMNLCLVILVTSKDALAALAPPAVNNTQNQLTLSSVYHLPTSITLIVASQLFVFSILNFVTFSSKFCCSALDILGVIITLCLIAMVILVGLQPHRTLRDLQVVAKISETSDNSEEHLH